MVLGYMAHVTLHAANRRRSTFFRGRQHLILILTFSRSYIDKDGNMAEIDDGGRWEIKKLHGEPEDVFRITRKGRVNEEWKYWTKGIGFLWEAKGVGWELGDVEKFTPKADVAAKVAESRTEASGPGDLTAMEQQELSETEQLPGHYLLCL